MVCSSLMAMQRYGEPGQGCGTPHSALVDLSPISTTARFALGVLMTVPTRNRLCLNDKASPQSMPAYSTSMKAYEPAWRSEEHTSELQSLMRISYAVFCLKKKTIINTKYVHDNIH